MSSGIPSFKTTSHTADRVALIKEELNKKGFIRKLGTFPAELDSKAFYLFYHSDDYELGYEISDRGDYFIKHRFKEYAFEDILKIIQSMDYAIPKQPDFDFSEPFSEVLVKNNVNDQWEARHYITTCHRGFMMSSERVYTILIPYSGYKKFHKTTDNPEGWWTWDKGNPMWVARRSMEIKS